MTTVAKNELRSAASACAGTAQLLPPSTSEKIRADFPILRQQVHGKPLVYLDNAATSQKPQVVIDAITRYYERDNANIHRGVHFLSEHATEEHEAARADGAGVSEAAHAQRNHLRSRRHRSHQSGRADLRPHARRRRAMKC